MFRSSLESIKTSLNDNQNVLIISLIAVNLVFNIIANAGFKLSALSPNWRGLLSWQVVGNFAGLITVITLTWLLRYLPLHVAFPITTGLTVIGVTMVAGRLFFHESISPGRWFGTFLVAVGIVFLTRK
jgi:multidrug transporter EmrE-like cation transporter